MPNLTPKEIKRITDGYLKAAELIGSGNPEHSCVAIYRAFKHKNLLISSHEETYLDIFVPSRIISYKQKSAVLTRKINKGSYSLQYTQLLRYDLLNLMAACWRDFR